ncbi:tripartite tricarboxylate transporter permease [Billgrantia aerodenitrificans]|uniref:Tripartite tricarboxylate transporter permease n=1 Tax=Billgrantia aerodenitrificans TaxID=2733483 RepID=A0ABS9ANI4_9GAMM|nr:tripartite tricarboxylate transporter permease [Halomonas aerodenitrificans]MCE8023211.1 tripartite tricarboxylate transporter permease [Halomonas aerodenitrificans]
MFDVIFAALGSLFSGPHLLYLGLGVLMGLCIGIFPGLGGIAGLSLLLPLLYGMDTISALAMLIGLVAVIPTSDTFTSVLMGIPGSSGSQATVLDGFPLAKKGQAARALSAAFTASLFGGLFGALVLTLFVLIARPIILAFGSAELFMLTLLGLSMVAGLAGKSLIKGLCACGLGLLFGTMGGAPATGEFRLSFDVDYLMDGIPLVVMGLGIFALPEIVDLLRRNTSISEATPLGGGWITGVRDMIRHKWLALRCAALGCIVGALPGLGGSVVDWIAYGHAVQTTKSKGGFGKGEIRGVIAPEASNNAKEGGAMIPTLLFGIPGSGSMAIFLGGMILIGLEPGPNMVSSNLDVTYTIIWSLALANVLGAGACLLLSGWVSRLTTIPYALMAPFMIMVICFAAFQATRSLGDLVALLAVGVLGIFLKRFGWPRPAFLIGFVLASGMENYLYQALQFNGWSFITKPGVLIIAVLLLVSVVIAVRQVARLSHQSDADAAVKGGQVSLKGRLPQVAFTLGIGAFFSYGLFDAFQVMPLARVFPAGISLTMLVLVGVMLVRQLRGKVSDPILQDMEQDENVALPVGFYHYLLWLTGLVLGCYLVGYVIAMTLFFVAFLLIRAHASLSSTLTLTACGMGFLTLLAHLMVLNLPSGLLQQVVDLPWPLG